jgi:hypothetical protein
VLLKYVELRGREFVAAARKGARMTFPTVEDCAAMSGPQRELLHQFDHVLRDALASAQRKARKIGLPDGELERACVTVMMSVAAGAALVAPQDPPGVAASQFSALAQNAFAWALNRDKPSDRRH